MTFYRYCLGGELEFRAIGDTPDGEALPLAIRQSILYSKLTRGTMVLQASDMVGEKGLVRGNAIALMLECDSEAEIADCYGKLSEGGVADHPLARTLKGGVSGDLTDKYGNQWLLYFTKTKQ